MLTLEHQEINYSYRIIIEPYYTYYYYSDHPTSVFKKGTMGYFYTNKKNKYSKVLNNIELIKNIPSLEKAIEIFLEIINSNKLC